MGLRFRKSIKIAPGVKLNLNKKSTSISFGGKHGGVMVNSKRGASYRVSAPGTGLSYTGKIGGSSNKKKSNYLYTDYDYDDSYEDYDVYSPSADYSSYHSFSVAPDPDPGPTLFQRMFNPEYFVPETWFGVVGYCLRYGVLPILVFLYLVFYAQPLWLAVIYAAIRILPVLSCIEIVQKQRLYSGK